MTRRTLIGVFLTFVTITCIGIIPLTSGGEAPRTQQTGLTFQLEAAPTPGTAAMRAYVNPETGAIEVGAGRMSPEALEKLDAETQNALRRDVVGLVPVYHPDGSVVVNLQGRFQSVSMARVDEGGTVTVCTDDAEEVHRVIEGETTREVE